MNTRMLQGLGLLQGMLLWTFLYVMFGVHLCLGRCSLGRRFICVQLSQVLPDSFPSCLFHLHSCQQHESSSCSTSLLTLDIACLFHFGHFWNMCLYRLLYNLLPDRLGIGIREKSVKPVCDFQKMLPQSLLSHTVFFCDFDPPPIKRWDPCFRPWLWVSWGLWPTWQYVASEAVIKVIEP